MTRSDTTEANLTQRSVSHDDVVCGFRVLRRLHTGERTHAFLASDAQSRHVVLRVFLGSEGPARSREELELAARVANDHVQSADDVGAAALDEPVLVCERLGRRLSELLENAGFVAAGSIVTLAAPLASALKELHFAGIAHGSVDVAHVRFAGDGRPVLVGADGGLPATPATIKADLEGLAYVVASALHHSDERTRSQGASQVTSWLQDQCSGPDKPPGELYDDLECRIFALAPPLPFAVGREATSNEYHGEGRRSRQLRERHRDSTLSALLEGELSFSLPAAVAVLRRIREGMRGRSRAARLAGVAALVFVVCLVGAFLLLPQSTSAREPGHGTPVRTTAPAAVVPAASPDLPPIDALDALLDARTECRHSAQVSTCLGELYEPDSPALDADLSAAESHKADPFPTLSLPATARTYSKPETSGGAVVVTIGDAQSMQKPVSVLMIRTETGWLLRDVFAV
ncbi:hypothetical protein [Paramicrobacterium agarici]|uniref:hypothetical protein n=1 Tax=Paramicrobacterium agarici TaxID=630514 RepID=UPI001152673A|nr:hypothetical protein [Microbacterium agarici]